MNKITLRVEAVATLDGKEVGRFTPFGTAVVFGSLLSELSEKDEKGNAGKLPFAPVRPQPQENPWRTYSRYARGGKGTMKIRPQASEVQIKVWVLHVDARCTDTKCGWHVNRMGNAVKEVNDRATEHACMTGHAVKVQVKLEKEIIPRKGESDEKQ